MTHYRKRTSATPGSPISEAEAPKHLARRIKGYEQAISRARGRTGGFHRPGSQKKG